MKDQLEALFVLRPKLVLAGFNKSFAVSGGPVLPLKNIAYSSTVLRRNITF